MHASTQPFTSYESKIIIINIGTGKRGVHINTLCRWALFHTLTQTRRHNEYVRYLFVAKCEEVGLSFTLEILNEKKNNNKLQTTDSYPLRTQPNENALQCVSEICHLFFVNWHNTCSAVLAAQQNKTKDQHQQAQNVSLDQEQCGTFERYHWCVFRWEGAQSLTQNVILRCVRTRTINRVKNLA